MNEETYEALKRIIAILWAYSPKFNKEAMPKIAKDIREIEAWIDEVAKEYEKPDCEHNPKTSTGLNIVCGNCSNIPF